MASETTTTAYTHLASIGRYTNVPVRRDGRFWWSGAQVHLAVCHSPRNVYDIRPLPAGPLPEIIGNGSRSYCP